MIDELGDETFADRIAEPLRALEPADETFEARAMSAVQAAAREDAARRAAEEKRSWWLRKRTVEASPLGMLALAAGVMALVIGGTSLVGRAGVPAPPAIASVPDTVHVVRFVFRDSSAQRVAIVGEFNQWDKSATSLRRTADGAWTIDLPLSVGRHEYAFVVYDASGERWVADPFGQLVRDEFGTQSSIISVGAPRTS